MDSVKTYEEACAALNIDPNNLPDVSNLTPEDQTPVIAHYKLMKVAEALNEGWKPDWSNREWKYYPYFYFNHSTKESGFGLSGVGHGWTSSTVGSRLVYKTSELAEYAGTQFEALYREYHIGK